MTKEIYDYLIVGTGFSGCVLAERLNSISKKILIIDKRNHIGGNCYDYYDKAGILVHKYGPHYFRSNFSKVKKYLSRFTDWIPHRYVIKSCIKGNLYDFPINRNTLNKFFNVNLKTDEEAKQFLEKIRDKSINVPRNAEEQVLKLVGKELYETFFRNYTIKQWDCHPKELDSSVTARIPIRTNDDDSYLNDSFQAVPKEGYTKVFEKMILNNKNIKVLLNMFFKEAKKEFKYKKLIYTGPIDEFFNYKFGKLKYRSLKFVYKSFYGLEYYQKYSQINYPGEEPYTRIVEIKHATHQKCPNTTIVYEYPTWDEEPYYPYPNKEERRKYLKYLAETKKLKNVYFIGRLASYTYLNMDQVVKQALLLFDKIKNE